MSAAVRILERVSRQAPFGVRLWDVAAGVFLADPFDVELIESARPDRRIRCPMNRSGTFYAVDVPGLHVFETSDPRDTTRPFKPFRVEIRDPMGFFLPVAFQIDLPATGLVTALPPFTVPPQPLGAAPVSPPAPVLTGVPMFSSASRPAPEGLAVVRAELHDVTTDQPAAWCLLAARIDGRVRGIGLADRDGRAALLFPYPDRSRPALTSPPPAVNDFRWSVELSAFYLPRASVSPSASPPVIPDVADIAAQLAHPRTLLAATGSPPQALPAQPLEYGVPLIARTAMGTSGPSSFLYVSPA